MQSRVLPWLLMSSFLWLIACGGGDGGNLTPAISVTISPTQATVPLGQTQPFTATVSNASDTSVTWRVNGATGGNSSVGTIDTHGVYTAPAAVPAPATVTVTAVSNADSTRSASATVTITSGNPISVTVVPANVSVTVGQSQTFTATVNGASDTSVTWQVNGATGGSSSTGTIDPNGVYTAPATVPSPATVTVTAISHADSSKSASAAVTIVASAGVSVSITPATATVQTGATRQFTATVANTTDTAVVWEVNGNQGGNSTTGTIDANGLYTAPATVPPTPTVTVTAVSHADTTRSASAQVTITGSTTVSVTLSPASVSVATGKTQQFQASVIHTSDTAVTWQVNGVTGGNSTVGTIDANGLYTAPAAVPSPAVVFVSATSHADATQSATAQVTIVAASSVQVRVSPGTALVTAGKTQQFQASVKGSKDTAITWQVNGIAGGNATIGTIDGNGTFTAPTAVPLPGTVTVTAVSAADPTRSAAAAASILDTSSSAPQMKGSWVFRVEGVFYSTIGSFVADGKGTITQGQEDNGTGQIPFTGTYSIAADGSGSASLQLADGSTQMLQFVLGPDGSGPCQRTDQISFGELHPQSGATAAPDLSGTWVLEADGSDFSQIGPIVAAITLKPDGSASGSLLGLSAAASPSATVTDFSVTGSYQVGSDGRGVLMLTSDAHGASRYVFDLRDADHLVLLGTPATGTAMRQSPDASFSTVMLQGDSVVYLRANDLEPALDQGIESATAGTLSFDGKGSLTGGTLDSNVTGTVASARPVTAASDTVKNDGQVAFSLAAPPMGPWNMSGWMASDREGVVMGNGGFGPLRQRQTSRTLDATFLRGGWAVQLYGYNGDNRRPETTLGTLTADGAGKLKGTMQTVWAWSSVQGSYTVDSSGRGTLQWNDGVHSRHFALNVVSDQEIDLIGLDGTETMLGQLTPALASTSTLLIAPKMATVVTGGTRTFVATGAAVTWQVNGIAGGNPTVGTIDGNGVYTAPAQVPSPAVVTVTAVATADSTQSASAQVTIVSSAPGLTVAPSSATVAAGGTLTLTADVSGYPNALVSWTFKDPGRSGQGTLTATGDTSAVYVAPAAVPDPATVTLVARLEDGSGSPPTAESTITVTAAPSGQLAALKGTWLLTLQGSDRMEVASLIADGKGHWSSGQADRVDPMAGGGSSQTTLSGNYAIRKDGMGETTLIDAGGQTETLYCRPLQDGTFAVQAAGAPDVEGALLPVQTVPAGISGTWMIESGSASSPAEVAQITFASDGSISGSDPLGSVTGSWRLDGSGRGRLTLQPASGTALTYAFYPVSAHELALIGAGGMGRAELDTPPAADALSGTWVFALRDHADIIRQTAAGMFATDGHGAIVSGIVDGTFGSGSFGAGVPVRSGSYSLSSQGQVKVTLQLQTSDAAQPQTITLTGYLDASQGFVQSDTGLYGTMVQQTAPLPAGNGLLQGDFLLALQGYFGQRSPYPLGIFAGIHDDGQGTVTGFDGYDGANTVSGSSTLGSDGRGTLTLTDSASHSTSHFAVYTVSKTDFIVVGTDPSGTYLGEIQP